MGNDCSKLVMNVINCAIDKLFYVLVCVEGYCSLLLFMVFVVKRRGVLIDKIFAYKEYNLDFSKVLPL